jgi:hypothetical protein
VTVNPAVDADDRHTRMCRELPTNRQVRDGGRPATTDEEIDRLEEVRAELRARTLEIHRHPWWETVDNRYEAERALWAAAAN